MGDLITRSAGGRGNYQRVEIATLLARYAALAVAVERRPGSPEGVALVDIDEALARIPERLFQVLELRGLKRLTNAESARELGVHPNTTSRRYMTALSWIRSYLNGAIDAPTLRELSWREWAKTNVEYVLEDFLEPPSGGPGRPASISLAVDELVLRLHCRGVTQRMICATLNERFPRADGRTWSRSSVRSVLHRYDAPQRARGRRPRPGTYRPGDITQPNYREVEFGEALCDPDELLAKRR
jgi:hypothetical protein